MRGFLLLITAISLCSVARSQCTPSGGLPPAPDCAGATQLSDGVSINSGTYSDKGLSGHTYSNVSLNGGTLVLCGATTMTDLAWNSGMIYISPGANIIFNSTIPNVTLNGSADAFYNFGTVTFDLNVACNKNGLVYNEAGASIIVDGDLTINQGLVYSNGSVSAHTVTINGASSSGTICLGPLSITEVTTIIDNGATNPVTVPGSSASCISFGNTITGSTPLTNSPNLILCIPPGATAPTPAQAGGATVITNCGGCTVALPVKLISFTGKEQGPTVELQWQTAMEQDLESFVIERSTDGRTFHPTDTVAARNQPSTYIFDTEIGVTTYFRLKMVNLGGTFGYSPVIVLEAPASGASLSLSSNPIYQSSVNVSVYVPTVQQGQITVVDDLGRVLRKMPVSLLKGNNHLQLDLSGISSGHYFLFFVAGSNKSQVIPFIKL